MGENLRQEEAAAFLQVKPSTLQQWRWSGRGPLFVKVGRLVRYRRADLEAFMQGRTFASTTAAQQAA